MVWRIALGLCLACPMVAAAGEAPVPFVAGEQLTYDVNLLGVRTAEAQLSVEAEGGEGLRVVARGRTVGAADSIFRLRQDAWCTLQGPALAPRLCRFTSRKRGSDRRREVKFDAGDKVVRERVLEDGRTRDESVSFPEGLAGVQEALSGLYDLRRHLPRAGETVRFRSVRKGQKVDVTATARGNRQITTPAGTFQTVEVSLRILQKQADDQTTEGTIYFSEDARRLPVLLRVAAPVGSLEAALSSASGTVNAEHASAEPRPRGGP